MAQQTDRAKRVRLGSALTYTLGRSFAFVARFPVLTALLFLVQLGRHFAEAMVREETALSLVSLLAALTLTLPAYPMVRWLHSGGDRTYARRLETKAVACFALVMALQAVFHALALFVWTRGPMAVGFAGFGLLFVPLIVRFLVAAPLGILIPPRDSMRVMVRDYGFALAFTIFAPLPLLCLQFLLDWIASETTSENLHWILFAAEAAATVALALVTIMSQYVVATRPAPLAPVSKQNEGAV
ncbi:hypothetical protein E3U23_08525 [Erythrobacter litoralis]|uniref:hypothetical protein n=1 Tax=Erythrobacter litoralis TaxID=39960 RepID=UPI0024358907|nr:hypothetical protein [Erythrobacter litoralis]MDG6079236.1 hypothetical protein [Erythrobacter litoralis]